MMMLQRSEFHTIDRNLRRGHVSRTVPRMSDRSRNSLAIDAGMQRALAVAAHADTSCPARQSSRIRSYKIQ